jgi:hypothetical protein
MTLDEYATNHQLWISVEYITNDKNKNKKRYLPQFEIGTTYVYTQVRLGEEGEHILQRYDRYPITDEDLLLNITEIIRQRKLSQIL